ncbi:MAG: hypothetical protein QM715_10955 [Nibricoccus sp.]
MQAVHVGLPLVCKTFWFRWFVAAALCFGCTAVLPRWWCGADGERWFVGQREQVATLAREVAAMVDRGVSAKEFTSDVSLFQHEWMFGSYQMAALALLQICDEYPELRDEFLPVAERAIDRLLSEEVRGFDRKSWGEDPLASLDGPNGHAAYLGYTNLVLAFHRRLVPQSRFAGLNDKISSALARRLRASPAGILQTYPHENYPIDNASVLASLLMHQKEFGGGHGDVTAPMLQRFQKEWRDKKSGLLFQAFDGRSGSAIDAPRASGTALAAYFISFGERECAAELFQSLKQNCAGSLAGFGFIREYPEGLRGQGDIDSGPIICGISPSGTGFAIAGCRIFRDRNLFVQLYRTAHLTGAPLSSGGRLQFVTGGPLGNAIMLAMLTAHSVEP